MGDTMREKFEAWCKGDFGPLTPNVQSTILRKAFYAGHEAGRQRGMEQAKREPLTEEQMTAIFRKTFGLIDSRPVGPQIDFIRAIEAEHGITPTPPAGDSDTP